MCGISGIYLKQGHRVPGELLRSMAMDMEHRGPDAMGLFERENLGIAHRRLKIIDLSDAANQPIFNEDGKIGVSFNGEIYNFKELRETLETRGHRFKSHTDTEVIVHAFEEWGTESFAKFNGLFVFALWDWRGTEPVLYLARDRIGAKPLLYSKSAHGFAFASELKPLLRLDWVKKELDRDALFAFLKFSHFPAPSTPIPGIRQLMPGSFLTISGTELTESVYWRPRAPDTSDIARKAEELEEELLDELEALLRSVVRRQIVSDVPVGCFLSGGVDSSLLAASYQELGLPALKTFSIGYRERDFDESGFAAQAAKTFGTEHEAWIAQPSDFFDLIPDIPKFCDLPLADPTLMSSLLLARFSRKKVTVALSGDGGDELFFGYLYQELLWKLRFVRSVPKAARIPFFASLEKIFHACGSRRLHPWVKFFQILQFENPKELYQYFIGTVGPLPMRSIAGLIGDDHPVSKRFFDALYDSPHVKNVKSEGEKIERIFFETFLVDTVLAKTDRSGMAYGLEARVPFLDNEMIDFSSRLPFEMKYGHGTKKFLLRRLLERKLKQRGADPSLAWRKKQGFSIPLETWLRGPLKYLLDEYLPVPVLARQGILNPKAVHQLVLRHLSGRENHSHLLWSLVTFQLWKEKHL